MCISLSISSPKSAIENLESLSELSGYGNKQGMEIKMPRERMSIIFIQCSDLLLFVSRILFLPDFVTKRSCERFSQIITSQSLQAFAEKKLLGVFFFPWAVIK